MRSIRNLNLGTPLRAATAVCALALIAGICGTGLAHADGAAPPPPPPPPLGAWESAEPVPASAPAVRDVIDSKTSDAVAYTQRHDWSVVQDVPPGAVVPPGAFQAPDGDVPALDDVTEAGGAAAGASTETRGRIVRSYFTPCDTGSCKKKCNPCCCGSPWSIGLYATSAVFEDPTGILGEPLPAGVTPFNFAANEYDPVGGARLRVVHRRGCTDAFEFRGTFYGKTDTSTRQTGQFAFSNAAGISPVATATVQNESLVWGFDINYWRTLRRSGRWHTQIGAGWRYLRIDETATVKDWTGRALANSLAESDVDNSLFAAQLMAGITFRAARRLELMADAKLLGGVMVNDVDITDVSILSGGAKNPSKSDSTFGWGVEATLEARYRFASKWWVRGGLEVLYVDGVQGATDAMDFSQSATGTIQPRISTSDRVISTLFLGVDFDL